MISCSYFLIAACAIACETTVTEFDTYAEALEVYKSREIAGYSVVIHELDFQGPVAAELRSHKNFTTHCEVL